MRRSIQLTTLRSALVIAEAGSILGASRCMGIHYSALSRRIRDLELTLGVILFKRHPFGVLPTPTGARFLSNLGRVLDDLDRTLAMVEKAGKGEAGRLSIGFDASLHTGELLHAATDFVRNRTDVAIRFVETSRDELAKALNERAIDLAIVTGRLRNCSGSSLQLRGSRLVVAVTTDHPLAERAIVEWAELEGHRVLTNAHPADTILFTGLAIAGESLPIVHNDVSRETLLGLVREGMGIAVVPENEAGPSANGIAFARLCNEGHPVRTRYFANWLSDNSDPVLAAFIASLRIRYHAP
ncbi:LysR family transcriptional regulator [Mesorhizobium sp. LNJC405B00]|uniref:LysR family transcriptional regulator n=1 Tax=Mesorhizobium sp. LNJC405B00 TaxID=1287281 RepID=UPI000A5C8D6E|nr:LysR family transcriptional regulator [Mesorhizobium sp. LNJC405B00]